MTSFYLFSLLLINITCGLIAAPTIIEKKIEEKSPETTHISFSVELDPSVFVYKDHIDITIDQPDARITSWNILEPGTDHYDPILKTKTKIYKKKISFLVVINKKTTSSLEEAALHLVYYTNNTQQPVQELIVPFKNSSIANSTINDHSSSNISTESVPQEVALSACPAPVPTPKKVSWSDFISNLIQQQQSTTLRLLFVLLLGIMLSLTPCIYPMIPITIGVLQSQNSNPSVMRNFLMALAYTLGISTTFALFGLLAGCVGPLCGQLLSNPWFIVGLVLVLAYFALSMLGFYDVRLPRFITSNKMPGGSFFAAYLFGAASGTFASPCVSPGLALILGMVASYGSSLLGFLFLFTFGIGLSVPLLVIGTLSNSFHLLPRAGLWMVEIKKLFGLLMIAVCFYYLSLAIPLWIIEWLGTIVLLLLAGYYLYHAAKLHSKFWSTISYGIGMLLISSACVTSFYAIKRIFLPTIPGCQEETWVTQYDVALQQAQSQHKLIFLDAWATYCSICIAINKKVLAHPEIQKTLEQFVPVKIDMTDGCNEQTMALRDRFAITGVPTLLIIDPTTQHVVKRWGSEIYTMPIDELQKELLALSKQ